MKDPQDIEAAIRDYCAGYTLEDAGQRHGMSAMTVLNWLRKRAPQVIRRHRVGKNATPAERTAAQDGKGIATLTRRFWEKVDRGTDDVCWLWRAHTTRADYGQISVGRKYYLAHRISWQIHFGEVPRGFHVLHRCDTPRCVNPAHLFLGSQQDNMADMWAKGRGWAPTLPGTKNPRAKLTDSDVIEIRASRDRYLDVCARFGIRPSIYYAIKSGKAWRHLPMPVGAGEKRERKLRIAQER